MSGRPSTKSSTKQPPPKLLLYDIDTDDARAQTRQSSSPFARSPFDDIFDDACIAYADEGELFLDDDEVADDDVFDTDDDDNNHFGHCGHLQHHNDRGGLRLPDDDGAAAAAQPAQLSADQIDALVQQHFRPERARCCEPPLFQQPLAALRPIPWQGPAFLPNKRFYWPGELVRRMLPDPGTPGGAAVSTSSISGIGIGTGMGSTSSGSANAQLSPVRNNGSNSNNGSSRLLTIDPEGPPDGGQPAASPAHNAGDSNVNDNSTDRSSTFGFGLNGNNSGAGGLDGSSNEMRPMQSRAHRNAFKSLKKPPQPHMCIRERSADGEELFINVMSWTRIMMPASPDDPIPLYGGMKVPRCNQRSPPNVYAVMVNPEILKHVGRSCQDPDEKIALVQLMSDFVEAMNPGLELSRCAEILVDRDLAGELKDIWCAVQAKRERDKETIQLGGVPTYSQAIANAAQRMQQQRTTMPAGGQQPFATVSSVPTATPAGPLLPEDAVIISSSSSAATTDADAVTTPTKGASSTANANGLNNNAPGSVAACVTNNVNNSSPKRSSSTDKDSGTATAAAPVAKQTGDAAKDEMDAITRADIAVTPVAQKKSTPPIKSLTPTAVAPPSSPPVATPPTTTKKDRLGAFLPNSCTYKFPFIKSKKDKKDKEKKNGTKEQSPPAAVVPEVDAARTAEDVAAAALMEAPSGDERLNANM